MTKQFLFTAFYLLTCILSHGQTIEDIRELGLTDSQLQSSFEERTIQLTNYSTGKRRKIKEGAFATIKMKGDTTKMEIILEAFLSDTIIVSLLAPRLTGKEIRLGFAEFKLLPLSDIESIEYSVRHVRGTYWASFLITLIGLEMAVLPVVMPLIIGNADEIYKQAQFPFIVVGGVILYIYGKKLQKKLTPKEYNLVNDWSYRVLKK